MTIRHSIQMAVLSLLLLAGAASAAESLSVLLQKGIFAEETEGNLDAAIKIYEVIVKEADANRSLVAQAQYRLGVCELKRGKKQEAATAFRKLIDRFADAAELVAKSRERLTELGQPASSVAVRQVWSEALDASSGSVSRDGQWLSFTDPATGDLAIRELTIGQNRRVTDKGHWSKAKEYAETSVFSPDGKRIAYSWWNERNQYDLRIVALDDSKPRVLLRKCRYFIGHLRHLH